MTIQEKIDAALEKAIKEKDSKRYINNLKFLKAETQRGKTKVMSDNDVVAIFVALIRKQNEMQKSLDTASDEYQNSLYFVNDIYLFLDQSIIDQIYIHDIQIIDWIESNVDLTNINVKNKNQLIGVVKKAFPYVDGNLVKESIAMMDIK